MAATPASVLTSSATIVHDAAAYYDSVALDNVKKKLRFNTLCTPKRLPKQSGLVHQMFRYIPFGTDSAGITTGGTQGTIGSGLAITTETVSATITQYFDFVNLSDLYVDTIIDSDSAQSIATEMGYRAGLAVDILIRTEFDSGSATTSTALVGAALGANDFRKMASLLRGSDVEGLVGDSYLSLSHPYVQYDLVSDGTAGGFIDISKYTNRSVLESFEEFGMIQGVRLGTSTNVGTSGAAATTKYWTYVVGKGAVAAVNLGDGTIGGGSNPNVSVINHSADKFDPAGVIKTSIAYNFKFAAKRLLSTSDAERYRQTPADSTIAS
jgi:N4-gp56 family major capsid protein